MAPDASIQHRGGVAIFYQESPKFVVEAQNQRSTNAVSFQLATGDRRWFVMGCYLEPDDGTSIDNIVRVMVQHPHEAALLAVGT